MTKRNWTPEQREASRRLRLLWEAKRRVLGLTQEKAAKILGYSHQSAAQQYLSGNIQMGTDAVIAWARLLGVSPESIDPSIKTKYAVLSPVLARTEEGPIELSRDEYDWVLLRRKLTPQQQAVIGAMVAGLVENTKDRCTTILGRRENETQ